MVWCINEIINVHSYFSIAVVFTVPLCNKLFYYIRINFFLFLSFCPFYFKKDIQHSNSAYYQPKAAENSTSSVLSQEIIEYHFSFFGWLGVPLYKLSRASLIAVIMGSLLHNIHCQSAALPLLKKAREKQTNSFNLKAAKFGCFRPLCVTANIYSFKINLFWVMLPII